MSVRRWCHVALLAACLSGGCLYSSESYAEETRLNGHTFTLPAGFSIELVAGPPLVDRPICGDFDEQGRLYIAESSGSNDKVQQQLEERPHRILRLEDTDGDGTYDRRSVFADKMMFPEGAMWLDGSLYVAAPPSIWKLTDEDGDGIAEKREEWFAGKTLTGCANDLHGPYRGPDGYVYWCKGAFAEQTYERPGQQPLVTRASHIFRRRPEGGWIESVMTGGMDNPVEVIFTPGGERIFTTTFLQHPGGGRRDGLIHALYGGVYGKRHGVLGGHPRTGALLPPLVHLGAAAPCGLARLESEQLGEDYRDNVLACSFNMHKITRHVLTPEGTTFATRDEDFLVSDNLDFHPTDVMEDGDGSLVVIDTGGWYKLCCPTSQLWKPDILGGIYRVRRTAAARLEDGWGKKLAWEKADSEQLAERFGDPRPAVRRRAQDVLARRGAPAVDAIAKQLESSDATVRTAAVWTLGRIATVGSRAAMYRAFADRDPDVRQAALHMVSLHRDRNARPLLLKMLSSDAPQNRRAAAEALGRLGDATAVPALLEACREPGDRGLQHSLTYALIELGDAAATREGLSSKEPGTRTAALIALDQMPGDQLQSADVVPLLAAKSAPLREAAAWVVEHHPQWAPELVPYFQEQLAAPLEDSQRAAELESQLISFAGQPAVSTLIAKSLADPRVAEAGQQPLLLRAIGQSGLKQLAEEWQAPLAQLVLSGERERVQQAITATRAFASGKITHPALKEALRKVGENDKLPAALRLEAMAADTSGLSELEEATFKLLLEHLAPSVIVQTRALAADVLSRAKLSSSQLSQLASGLRDIGPLELDRVLAAFRQSKEEQLGLALLDELKNSVAAVSLPADKLAARFKHFPTSVQGKVKELQKSLEMSLAEQREQLESLLASLPEGDIRRGQQVFHGEKAACKACHAMGYLGGNIGPDLTRIGRIRTDRDLLEAILYPSVSFVRSYEPVNVITNRGQVINGLVREDNGLEVVITTSERKNLRIRREDIEEMVPSKVSIMPAGLDKQLTKQQMADLLAFLRSTR